MVVPLPYHPTTLVMTHCRFYVRITDDDHADLYENANNRKSSSSSKKPHLYKKPYRHNRHSSTHTRYLFLQVFRFCLLWHYHLHRSIMLGATTRTLLNGALRSSRSRFAGVAASTTPAFRAMSTFDLSGSFEVSVQGSVCMYCSIWIVHGGMAS
jgi:hypothetical protein